MCDDDFGEHAVDAAAAPRRCNRLRAAPAVNPPGEEDARHAIARFEPADAIADGDDLASAVRQRDAPVHVAAASRSVLPAHDEQIALIQRYRADSHQHLAGTGHRRRYGLQRQAEFLPLALQLVLTDCGRPVSGGLRMQDGGGTEDTHQQGNSHARHSITRARVKCGSLSGGMTCDYELA
jgi:hypothetical protein